MKSDSRIAISAWAGGAALWLLLATVAIAPLPFGSNGPESTTALFGLSGLVLAISSGGPAHASGAASARSCACVGSSVNCFRGFRPFGHRSRPSRDCLCLSLTPFGPKVQGSSAPPRDRPRFPSTPKLTWNALAKAGGYFAVGISAALLLRDPQRRRTACTVLAVAGPSTRPMGLSSGASAIVAWYGRRRRLIRASSPGPFINRKQLRDLCRPRGACMPRTYSKGGRRIALRHGARSWSAVWRENVASPLAALVDDCGTHRACDDIAAHAFARRRHVVSPERRNAGISSFASRCPGCATPNSARCHFRWDCSSVDHGFRRSVLGAVRQRRRRRRRPKRNRGKSS